jgi:hypothetical protein
MTKQRYTILLLLFAVAGFSYQSRAQESTLKHFFTQSPLSLQTNPANLSNDAQWFFGIPVLSNFNINANMGVSYSDMFRRTPDNSIQVKPSVLDKVRSSIPLNGGARVDLVSFGFRGHPQHLITFSTSVVADVSLALPGDAFRLLIAGNRPGEALNIKMNPAASAYFETAIGYSFTINDSWKVGARVKYLLGMANLYGPSSNIILNTDPTDYSMRLRADALLHTSNLSSLDSDPLTPLKRCFDNPGFAFDFGVRYNTEIEGLSVGLSLIDWGWINWTSDLTSYEAKLANTEFVFTGLSNLNGNFQQIIDTLKNSFGFEKRTGTSYRAPLPGKIYIDATYDLTQYDKFGFLFGTRALDHFSRTTFTLMYNRSVGEWLSVSLGNNFMRSHIFNPSMALYLKGGTFQFFLAVENLSSVSATTAHAAGLHFGLNLTFNSKAQPVKEESSPRFYDHTQ